jgi:ribonuclease HI
MTAAVLLSLGANSQNRIPLKTNPTTSGIVNIYHTIMPSYYAVKRGVKPGVFATWAECGKQVLGFPGAVYRKFQSRDEAERFAGVSMAVPQAAQGKCGGGKRKPERVSARARTRVASTSSESSESSGSGGESDADRSDADRSDSDGDVGERSGGGARELHIYTDGACSGNGTRKAAAGYGVFIDHPALGGKATPLNAVSLPVPAHMSQTNNVAELLAIIHALRFVRLQALDLQFARIVIHSDSSYAIHCLGEYGARLQAAGWRDRKPNLELVREGFELMQPLRGAVSLEHVRAHTAGTDPHSRGNHVADRLAVEGAARA